MLTDLKNERMENGSVHDITNVSESYKWFILYICKKNSIADEIWMNEADEVFCKQIAVWDWKIRKWRRKILSLWHR